jgi:hypothetical protein
MAENFLLENGRLVYAKAYQVGGRSGAMTGLAAAAQVYSLRNPAGSEPIVMSQLRMCCWTETAFTAAQGMAFTVYKCSQFTATGGGGINLAGVRKRTTDTAALIGTDIEAKIASAAALTGATATFDVDEPIDSMQCDIAVATSAGFCSGSMLWTPANRIPIALEANEGILVVSEIAMGAGGVMRLVVVPDIHKA